jgi:hypothetical protein
MPCPFGIISQGIGPSACFNGDNPRVIEQCDSLSFVLKPLQFGVCRHGLGFDRSLLRRAAGAEACGGIRCEMGATDLATVCVGH